MKRVWIICALLGAITISAAAQAPKYGVTVTSDKKFNFSALKTYVWTVTQPSPDKLVDRQITAAVDRELAALNLKKQTAEPGDILVTYYSLSRTDTDLKAKPDASGASPQQHVGTLVVVFREPANRKEVLRLRLDTPIDADATKVQAAIDAGVAAMFARYPTRKPA